jgi:hypothetical protein
MVIVVGHIQIPLVTPKLSVQDSARQILDKSGLMEGVTRAILFWDPDYTDVRCYK